MAVILPYQPGMVLGRTYDLKNLSSGIDIFSEEAVENVQTTRRDHNTMKYSVIKSSQDINNILGISGDISLKAKAGLINVNGMGSYFSEDIRNDNTVKILARAHVETETVTMKTSTPREGWTKQIIGSHYIRSITYGGDLIVSIEIGGSDSKQKEDIKAKLEADLNLMTASVRAKTNTEKLNEGKNSRAQVKIEYFSTTPRGVMPRDVDGMLKALDSFKEEVMKVNDGKGVPFSCELLPLGFLDQDIPMLKYSSNEILLQQLEDYYDDVRSALTKLDTFTKRVEVELTEEEDKNVREVTHRMEMVMDVFNDVIFTLDLTSDGKQVKPALQEYKKSKKTGGFYKEVTKLIEELSPNKESTPTSVHEETGFPPGIPLDLVLVGKSAQGKTSTGNTIFGSQKFPSKSVGSSETLQCVKVSETVRGRRLTMVDIQGSKTLQKEKDVFPQFIKMLLENPDGFHAFLIVMSAEQKMTDDEVKRFSDLKQAFGDILFKYSVIVFTGGDTFKSRMEQEGKDTTFDQYIQEDDRLKSLIQDCGNRYVLMNNMESEEAAKFKQVAKLVGIVSKMAEDNDYARYTNYIFKISAVVNINPNLFFLPEHVYGIGAVGLLQMSKVDPKAMALTNALRLQSKDQNLLTFMRIFIPEFIESKPGECVVS